MRSVLPFLFCLPFLWYVLLEVFQRSQKGMLYSLRWSKLGTHPQKERKTAFSLRKTQQHKWTESITFSRGTEGITLFYIQRLIRGFGDPKYSQKLPKGGKKKRKKKKREREREVSFYKGQLIFFSISFIFTYSQGISALILFFGLFFFSL